MGAVTQPKFNDFFMWTQLEAKVSGAYLSPKLEVRSCPEKGGWGVFSVEPIAKDSILCVWGGIAMTGEQALLIPEERWTHGLQVEENVYLIPIFDGDDADDFNHSCNPNAGLSGQLCLIAMRDINADEEICFDYAMSDSSDYDEFECHCGSPNCRGRVTGNDWKLPELQERYNGYFIPYLQRRIAALQRENRINP